MRKPVFVILLSFYLSSCAKSIIVEQEPNAIFSYYKTYSWNILEENTKNPYYNNPSINQHISATIEHTLAKKGLQKVATNSDILVDYHVFVKENSFQKTYCPTGYYRGGRYLPEIANWSQCDVPLVTQNYDDGTLIIDIIDSRTQQLIWRGSAKDAIDNPNYASEILGNKVHQVLKKLPIKP